LKKKARIDFKGHSVYCETHSPKPILKQFKDFDQILTFVADKIRILHEQGEQPLSEFAILYTKRSLAREQTPTAHELIVASIESRASCPNGFPRTTGPNGPTTLPVRSSRGQ
jgi:hypothetical protein